MNETSLVSVESLVQDHSLRYDASTGLMLPTGQHNKPIRLSENLLLALIPLVSYFALYRYQSGYASHFGYPKQLVAFDLSSIFGFLDELINIGAFLGFLIVILYRPILWLARKLPVLALAVGALLFALPVALDSILGKPIWFSATILSMYILFAIWRSYQHIKQSKSDRPSPTESLLKNAFDRLNPIFLLAVFGIIWVLLISSNIGKIDALLRDTYYVIPPASGRPELVILHMYGNTCVAAPFKRQTGETERTFYTMDLSSTPEIVIRKENLGRLKPKPEPDPLVTLVNLLQSPVSISPIATPNP
jgi:hypothetical protein